MVITNGGYLLCSGLADKFAAESDRILASHHIRVDRPNKDRSQRVRKLQLSDVDW